MLTQSGWSVPVHCIALSLADIVFATVRPFRRGPRTLVAAVALLHGFAVATAAQTTAPADIHRWLAPDAATQAAAATTAIPPGAGAILVPSMSGPDSEPQSLVFRGDERVASGPNGARIFVEPGAYLVRVGSGPVSQMVTVPVDVQGGATTVVPVRWGGLRIEVVDERNLPHRGVYGLQGRRASAPAGERHEPDGPALAVSLLDRLVARQSSQSGHAGG